ncbi:MAG: hypothetical protein ACJA08_000511 [Cyclobacteriaceae bacterium]|jgi:hypothetical protein
MKKQKLSFNKSLIRFHKYRRKLQRLELAWHNQRRQGMLQKHIERLHGWLSAMILAQKPNQRVLQIGQTQFCPGLLILIAPQKTDQWYRQRSQTDHSLTFLRP